jgi:DNA-directed RNA polymerase subunit RPC12/RpoP
MTYREFVTCPHCGAISSVEYLRKFKLLDVHPVRKGFDQLEARQMEREYICDRCEKKFYGTLLRIATADLNDGIFYQGSGAGKVG